MGGYLRFCVFWTLVVFGAGVASGAPARVHAVASFSILADMVERIGGGRVSVVPLIPVGGDPHVFRPSPTDLRLVAGAEILFINGLGFEGWLERLVEGSGYAGPVVVASAGVDAVEIGEGHGEHGDGHEGHDDGHEEHGDGHEEHDDGHEEHGDGHEEHDDGHAGHDDGHEEHDDEHHHAHEGYDSHAWQSLVNARLYARNIADSLIRLDPEGTEIYASNLDRYLEEIVGVDREVRAAMAAVPPVRRVLVTSHDAFRYFAREYGIETLTPVGRTDEAEASAGDLAEIIRQVRERRVAVVFPDSGSDPRLLQQISRETGARVGEQLYSDTISGPGGPASSYLEMMRHNIRLITEGMAASP